MLGANVEWRPCFLHAPLRDRSYRITAHGVDVCAFRDAELAIHNRWGHWLGGWREAEGWFWGMIPSIGSGGSQESALFTAPRAARATLSYN
jgi:ribosome modulation factor